ncbi:polysaccharide deacetylase family protein [Thermodesulfobacteriota bacterium]
MKQIIKTILIYTFYYFKIYSIIRFINYLFRGPNLTILVYHSFTKDEFATESVSVSMFEDHVKYLIKNFNVEPIDRVIRRLKQGKRLKRDTLCITIDDGFADNYELAYPILKKYNLSATIFVTAGCLEQPRSLNTSIYNEVRPDKVYTVNKIDRLDVYRLPKRSMLTWEQAQELAENNIEIGSHTLYHPILTKIPFSVSEKEIVLSKQMIESELNREIKYFAFPNGEYNKLLCETIRRSGYHASFIVKWDVNYSGQDLYQLIRIPIGNYSAIRLAGKMNMIFSDP